MLPIFLILAATAPATPAPDAPVVSVFSQATLLDAGDLAGATAREDVNQIAAADQTAAVSNSSVVGQSTTGTVAIDGNAFQNLSGFAILNTNTGNNVAINAALTVNVIFTPQP